MAATNVQTSTQPVEIRRTEGLWTALDLSEATMAVAIPPPGFCQRRQLSAGPCGGSDHVLRYEAAAPPGFFPNLTGAIAIAQSLAAVTFSLGGSAARKRLQNTEARLAATSQYVAEKG